MGYCTPLFSSIKGTVCWGPKYGENKVPVLNFILGERDRHRNKLKKMLGDAVIKAGKILETLEFEMEEGGNM